MKIRETILAKSNRRYVSVEVDGEAFWICSLTEAERSQQELTTFDHKTNKVDLKKLPEAKLKMLCLCLVEGSGGDRCFDVSEWKLLQDLDSRLVAKLYAVCLKHNGYEDDEVEDLVKNSE